MTTRGDVDLRLEFDEDELRRLRRILSEVENVLEDLRQPTSEALDQLKTRLQLYPPPPPNSTYVRTYRLQDSWHETAILSRSRLGTVQSDEDDVPYNRFVMSDADQAEIHQGRWDTVETIAEEEADDVAQIYQLALERLLRKYDKVR